VEYAIVDLETTGGDSRSGRVIEVAIYVFDGDKIIDEFASLVNPGRSIPPFITNLTGITNEMLEDAPAFDEIADKVDSLTHERIFVAHNVGFDYSFLRTEFKLLDRRFIRKRICTVRLTRAIFPNIGSYSLGNLCKKFDITIHDRHRAFGDALATTALLKQLIVSDIDGKIEESLKRYSRESMLPPNLPKEDFEDLPEEPGVYFFHNQKGKIIYVGKANNLRDRVSGHFMDNDVAGKSRQFKAEIFNVSYELSGNELIALLLESAEIKKLWPKYNSSQKRPPLYWSIRGYTDQLGYTRLVVARGKSQDLQRIFISHNEAWGFLKRFSAENGLCAKLSGLQKSDGACYAHENGVCSGACLGIENPPQYNKRVQDAINEVVEERESYAIIGNGRSTEESSVVLVEEGKYVGFGFISEPQISSIDDVKEIISPQIDNPDIQRIISWYLSRNPRLKRLNFA